MADGTPIGRAEVKSGVFDLAALPPLVAHGFRARAIALSLTVVFPAVPAAATDWGDLN